MTEPTYTMAVIIVNFNNSRYTAAALASLAEGEDAKRCVAIVVDNASGAQDRDELQAIIASHPGATLLQLEENLGYFAGLNVGIDFVRSRHPHIDFMIVGNNDLEFPRDFIGKIEAARPAWESHVIVSPDIVTPDGRHQNPHGIHGISRLREIVYDLYYFSYTVARIIRGIANLTARFTSRTDHRVQQAGPIVLGFGACYILCPRFFQAHGRLWAPSFLMGEELFLARQLECQGHRIQYDPTIRVVHRDNSTVGMLPSHRVWRYARDAHVIYRTFVRPFRWRLRASCDEAPRPARS